MGAAAHQGVVIGAFEAVRDELDLQAQTAQVFCITSVAQRRVLRDYLKAQKLPFVESILENQLVRNSALQWENFVVMADASAGSGTTAGDDAKHTLHFIPTGEGSPLRFAARTPAPRVFESETYRGTRITDEFSYGIDVVFPERGRIVKQAIT